MASVQPARRVSKAPSRPAGTGTGRSFAGVYASLLIFALLEKYVDTALWAVLSLAAFLWFSRLCIDRYRGPAAILFSFTFAKLNLLIALIAIANHLYIVELGIVANQPAHAPIYAILACGFMHVACASATWMVQRFPGHPQHPLSPELKAVTAYAAIGVTWILILFFLIIGATEGFPLLTHTDRFVFRAEQSALFLFLINGKPIFAALLGLARFRLPGNPVRHRVIEATMVVLTIMSLLFGDKFASLIVMLVTYFMPMLAFDRRRFRLRPALVIAGSLLFSLAGAMTYYIYSDYGLLGYDSTVDKLLGRATGNGQLWYAASNDKIALLSPDPSQLGVLANLSLSRGDTNAIAFENHAGIFYMVRRYATARAYASIYKGSGLVQFTGATEAYFMLITGILPMLGFLVILALATGLIAFYMIDSLRDGAGIGVLAASYLLSFAYVTANQAQPWQLFGIRTVVYGGIVVAIDYAVRALTRSSRAVYAARARGRAEPPMRAG